MRLIDADELNELMTAEWFLDSLAANESPREIKKKLENAIDSVPLAYDVEKVVEQLKEMKEAFIQGVEFAIDNGLQVSEEAIRVYREITKGE